MQEAPSQMALYSLYLATAEKVSDRRAAANAWMLSVNSAVVGVYGVLAGGLPGAEGSTPAVWSWAMPAVGVLVCLAWSALIDSYRKLNAAKFKVLQEIEAAFPCRLFATEQAYYEADGHRSLARVERWIPWSFAALHLGIAGASLLPML